MGYLLKEALKTICGVNQWSYAVFWKTAIQNPKLLIWEESYYEPVTYAGLPHISGIENPDLALDEWEACWVSAEGRTSQTGNNVHSLVNKMMMDHHVNIVGEGLVGRAAFTGNYQWIFSENYTREFHPPEVLNELSQQRSAGMQTVAVIPVLPHGVVQLGSSMAIMENMGFVNDVKSLVLQLGCVPGALLSDTFTTKEPAQKTVLPLKSFSEEFAGANVSDSTTSIADSFCQQSHSAPLPVLVGQSSFSVTRQIQDNMQSTDPTVQISPNLVQTSFGSNINPCVATVIPSNPVWLNPKDYVISQQKMVGGLASSSQKYFVTAPLPNKPSESSHQAPFSVFAGASENIGSFYANVETKSHRSDIFQAPVIKLPTQDDHITTFNDDKQYDYQSSSLTNANYGDLAAQSQLGDDLFDIFGMDLKNQLLRSHNNTNTSTKCFEKVTRGPNKIKDSGSDFYSVNEGISESGIFSTSGSDHLLDAVVSKAQSASNKSSEDNISTCKTTITKNTTSSPPINVSSQMQADLVSVLPRTLTKSGVLGSSSIRSGPLKEDARNCSQANNSIYGSQISSWVEQGKDMKCNSSVSTGFSKRPDEPNKSNRKRLKPGENPRPRPKDRQMIQDRVKELREIVPNGGKCSIDALLERTIKHMLFLQSVTKHADKLRQTGDSKIISKEGGLLLKDNTEGGATWAYEVGSQSMVCPIIVEDLNPPRQMLVEMLCEERGLFLEIADIIRGLGLTILKGVMENRSEKIWARFAVEANRDVTRMEIFLSLVRLLEQTVKTGTVPASCLESDNMMVHHSFHQTPSISAAGRPESY